MAASTKPAGFFPKTRSRTGCFTCRKRKKKCDECYPVCSGCARNFLCCVWPERSSDSLPKGFKIDTDTGDYHLSVEKTKSSVPTGSIFPTETSFSLTEESKSTDDEVPAKMCSVISIDSYEHEVPELSSEDDAHNFILFKVSPPAHSVPLDESVSHGALNEHDKFVSKLLDGCSPVICEIMFAISSYCQGGPRGDYLAGCHFKKTLELLSSSKEQGSDWLGVAVQNIRGIHGSFDLQSEENLRNVVESLRYDVQRHNIAEETVLTNFLFGYSVGIAMLPEPEVAKMVSPFQLFDQIRDQVSTVLFAGSNNAWLRNVILGCAFNSYECLCKLLWIMRQSKSLPSKRRADCLGRVKKDMTLIWMTLQTSEIQLESIEPHEHSRSVLYFAKYLHQALELLQIKISDPGVESTSPVVTFYLNQLINMYQMSDGLVPGCLKVLPLFVASCAAQTIEQRVFTSKELYLVARDLNLRFVEKLVIDVEECWCLEEAGGAATFDALATGFHFES